MGYRGLIIEQTDELARGFRKCCGWLSSIFGPRLAHFAADEALKILSAAALDPSENSALGKISNIR